jgi:single-stranded DNA-binding protein
VKVYVSGELRVSSYQGKDGQNHQDLSVWVNNFDFMGGGQRQQQPSTPQQIQNPKDLYAKSLYDYATGSEAQQPRQQVQQPSQPTGGNDDLPF